VCGTSNLRREINYTYLLETKGTTPNVSPEAAWTNTEKIQRTAMEPHSEVTLPSSTHSKPATVCTNHRPHSLPLIPKLLPILSDNAPPIGLENKFASPTLAAIIPAT